MNNDEHKTEPCNCKELAEKLIASLKNNERLEKMMRDLRQENETLKSLKLSSQNRLSGSAGSHSGTTGNDKEYKEKFEALFEVNHGWKKDYEELQMRFEMLKGEKRLLEDEEQELKIRVNELEKRQGPLESELTRLAAALYAQQGNNIDGHSEEQCEILKSQIIVYKEDFERERKDREKLHEEKEKYKHLLEDAEEIIRKLAIELDSCKARQEVRSGGWSENGYLSERVVSSPREGNSTVLLIPNNDGIREYRAVQIVINVIPNSNVLPLETGNPCQNDERGLLQEGVDYISDALLD